MTWPGTLAYLFQVESNGEARLEPVIQRQKQQAASLVLLLNQAENKKCKKSIPTVVT